MFLTRQAFAIAVAAVGLSAIPARAAEAPVLVNADQFRCLTEKIRLVPAEPKGVYVNIRNCRSDGIRIVRHLVPPPRQADNDGVESLLFLRPPQIRCIARHRQNMARIAAPAGSGRLRLMLDPCGR